MSSKTEILDLVLSPEDNERLANLCGQFNEHLQQIEKRLGVEINNRGAVFSLKGTKAAIQKTGELLKDLYISSKTEALTPERVHFCLQESGMDGQINEKNDFSNVSVRTRKSIIKVRSRNQVDYVRNIQSSDLTFGIGPAGTGKTYLAVACAVEALETEKVSRLVLVRPAVEAGERLGFLPGDLAQKVDPYLRPIYDALYEMIGFERVAKLMERSIIEVAPLAYMRGRTLNDAFIILDEAQNTTKEQMKMFLTRIGFGSVVVVTGDVTQIDLPREHQSGLRQIIDILKEVEGIKFTHFSARDVVRHPLVQRIVIAYEEHDKGNAKPKL